MEEVIEILLSFIMLYLTLFVFETRILRDISYHSENTKILHFIVHINKICNESTGDWRTINWEDIKESIFKIYYNGDILYYCNGNLLERLEDCNVTCQLIGLPVVIEKDGTRYHGIIYGCLD